MPNIANPSCTLTEPNSFTHRKWKEGDTRWVYIEHNLFGKIKTHTQHTVTVAHWKQYNNQLKYCTGCQLSKNKNKVYVTSFVPNPKITPGLILPGKLKFDQDLTKLFPEITDTLWDLHQSIKVLRSIKARLTMNTTNDNKSNPIATWTIEDTLYTLSTREKTWPSIMKAALTAVITLSIVIPQKTELVLETDIMYIKQVVDNYVNKNIQSMQIIDRHDLANHIRCILVITNSQELLQDVHVLQLQNESIPYNLKTVVKHAFQAAEYSEWYCQNRVMQMNDKGIIDWQKTYDYINYDYRPMTRYTHAAKSKLKTFQIKILTNELPHLLNLHHRAPANYPNPTCPSCTKKVEDEKHWLRCKANIIKLSTIIEEVLDENSKKKKFTKAQTKKYIEEFERNYI
ncbi:107_t:CDS:2 [Gigaspora rosea]|nr:107_t:CDS:2 [Gigaspora rosea]